MDKRERERENMDTKIDTREGEDSEEIEPVLFFVAYEIKEKIRKPAALGPRFQRIKSK